MLTISALLSSLEQLSSLARDTPMLGETVIRTVGVQYEQ